MNKAYFIVPILGVAAFTFFYMNTVKGIEEKTLAQEAAAKQAREDKRLQEVMEREKAYAEAIKLQAKRKKEREERDAKERAEKEQIANLRDQRDKAFRERDRQAKTATRLGDEIKIEEEEVAKLKAEIEVQKGEIAFLGTYVKKAADNQKQFETLLNKIDAAEKAAAAAARAAAAAKKS